MTSTQLIMVIAVAAAVILALVAARSGGPRVTQIDRTTTRERDEDDA